MSNVLVETSSKAPQKKPSRDNKHDFGHDRFVEGLFKYCHCFCPKCWQSYKTIGSEKRAVGRCICGDCSCNNFL